MKISHSANTARFAVSISIAIAAFAAPTALQPASAAEGPGKGVKLTACTSTSLEGWFREVIVKKGLEELGYEVAMPVTLSVPAEHQAVATGDCSYSFDHWNQMHTSFIEPVKDQVVLLGPGIREAGQGILASKSVADKVGLQKLEQLRDPEIAKIFDTDGNGKANLCCTAPGWGAELVVNHLIKQLNLADTVDHDQGEYTALIADVVARAQRGEPVLFYTWTPNWLLDVIRPGNDVVWLEVDPKDCPDPAACSNSNTGFALNDIYMVTNKELADNNPAMVAFLNSVNIPMPDLNAQNLRMHNGENSEEDVIRHADEWIATNKDMFESWVTAGQNAAK